MDIINIIQTIKNNPDNIEKILKTIWDGETDDFLVGLSLASDNSMPKFKKVPMWDEDTNTITTLTMEDFHKTIEGIKHGSITDAMSAFEDMAEKCSTQDWNGWFRKILTKEIINELPMNDIAKTLSSFTDLKKFANL